MCKLVTEMHRIGDVLLSSGPSALREQYAAAHLAHRSIFDCSMLHAGLLHAGAGRRSNGPSQVLHLQRMRLLAADLDPDLDPDL
jgi:hypothetical protein